MSTPLKVLHLWDIYYALTVSLDGAVISVEVFRSRRAACAATLLWQELGAQCVIEER